MFEAISIKKLVFTWIGVWVRFDTKGPPIKSIVVNAPAESRPLHACLENTEAHGGIATHRYRCVLKFELDIAATYRTKVIQAKVVYSRSAHCPRECLPTQQRQLDVQLRLLMLLKSLQLLAFPQVTLICHKNGQTLDHA